MRILFIYPNINGYHVDAYSFGLASIVAIAKSKGHVVKVVILKSKEEYDGIMRTIEVFNPNVVGFSSVSSQFSFVEELAIKIKEKYPSIITVCGGIHVTIYPGSILKRKALDAIFLGESEYSFVDFLDRVEKGKSYKDVDNIGYIDQGAIKVNKLKPLITNLNDLPYPDKESCFFKENIRITGYASFLFSRGCPYLCTYCSNHAIAKLYNMPVNTPRYRSPESSIREIEEAKSKFLIKKILIVDDIFGLDKKWRDEFCEKYKKCVKIKFQCLLRANLIDEEFIRLLKSAGCCKISIGVESGSEYIRNKVMNRNMSNKQISKAFELTRKYGLQTNAINIIGIPGETEEMIQETISLNRKIKPTTSGINIFYPYKGTKLGDYCFNAGLVDEQAYYNFSNERRATILKYPDEYKKKLTYYRENWDNLIYPFDIRRRFRKAIIDTPIINNLRRFKRYLKHRLTHD